MVYGGKRATDDTVLKSTAHAHRWGAWLKDSSQWKRKTHGVRLCINGWCPIGQYRNGRLFTARPDRVAEGRIIFGRTDGGARKVQESGVMRPLEEVHREYQKVHGTKIDLAMEARKASKAR